MKKEKCSQCRKYNAKYICYCGALICQKCYTKVELLRPLADQKLHKLSLINPLICQKKIKTNLIAPSAVRNAGRNLPSKTKSGRIDVK